MSAQAVRPLPPHSSRPVRHPIEDDVAATVADVVDATLSRDHVGASADVVRAQRLVDSWTVAVASRDVRERLDALTSDVLAAAFTLASYGTPGHPGALDSWRRSFENRLDGVSGIDWLTDDLRFDVQCLGWAATVAETLGFARGRT